MTALEFFFLNMNEIIHGLSLHNYVVCTFCSIIIQEDIYSHVGKYVKKLQKKLGVEPSQIHIPNNESTRDADILSDDESSEEEESDEESEAEGESNDESEDTEDDNADDED